MPLTPEDNQEIKTLRASGNYTLEQLATVYGVSRERIRQIAGLKGALFKGIERTCIVCGKTYWAKNTVGKKARLFKCSTTCHLPLPKKFCDLCEQEFQPTWKKVIYCSACLQNRKLEINNIRMKVWYKKNITPAKRKAYYQKNKKHIIEYHKVWSAGHRPQLNEQQRNRYKANPEKYRAYELAYRTRNAEKLRIKRLAYYEANKEVFAIRNKARYQRRKLLLTDPK